MVQALSFAEVGIGALRTLAARAFGGVLLLCALIALASPAQAQVSRGWTVCNQTSFVVETATGRPDGRAVTVSGWVRIRPGDCRVVLLAPLDPGVHFLYARSSQGHRGGVREWAGDEELCVDVTGSFALESPPDCAAMGLEARKFRPVLIERRNGWNVNLEETETFTLERARAAGIQRLMNDAGLAGGRIDGMIGRKTRAALEAFLVERKLPKDTSDEDLIDILEQVAINRARDVGMTLCNRTDSRIWAAIARRTDDWESRGWWQIDAGGCVRVIDERLLLVPHFVYGEMEQPNGVRRLARAGDTFCVARSKFAIVGRTDCGASAYRTEKFVATTPPADGKLVFEFFERDFGPATAAQ
jgi:uncharacterized membrane protein